MEQYEVAVLYHPDLEIDLSKATKKVEKVFKDAEAKIVKTDDWGKRKLAYKIAGQDHGIYVFYTVEISPEKVADVDQALRISDEVIRYLITKPDLKAIAKAEEAKAKKDKRIGNETDSDKNQDEDDSQ